ncbi:MAG: glucose-6-phosphate isomerase [Oscillospiraceae bacterium]|jgi:glucose-6-phosphate isomerase|nr:glucose-6-phosphate isomerase [Oscillospiraceae bacterium]
MAVKLNSAYLKGFINEGELSHVAGACRAAHDALHNGTGAGSDFLGWLNLPSDYDKEEFARIKTAAEKIRKNSEVAVVLGIGGSYLGARAVIEALKGSLYNSRFKPEIYFAGNSISPAYMNEILSLTEDRDFSVVVVSKSGTTTETALAFRVFKELAEKRYGSDGARERIYAVTDKERGTLKGLSGKKGYETFVIPDDVGGRYSVLTAVGLLPIAVAGCDIGAIMAGAEEARRELSEPDLNKNDCYKYAALRNILARKGFNIEMLVAYENSFTMMNEWFKQLFGESEGKDGKGLFPSSAVFSTDLHSLGQYIQDGSNIIFETVLRFKETDSDFFLKDDAENADGLNFLSGRNMSEIREKAFQGTLLAHTEGKTPNIVLESPKLCDFELGYLLYFFEKACAVSGYILGVNPFDQPGVEAYKKNMFALLGKPGYEAEKSALEAKLADTEVNAHG